ncbi:MAG: hypothetical protein Kow0068_06970 [Marinilabiliales bacterium]
MKYFVIIVLIIVCFGIELNAQCCSAGNPVGGIGTIEWLGNKELKILTSYKYSHSSEYFHENKRFEIPYIDKSYYDFLNTSLSYGATERISFRTELGYFFDKTQELNINNEELIIRSSGIGDLGINANYTVLKRMKPFSQLVFSVGTRLPVGKFDEKQDGITIPVSLQPSSGALKYNFSVFYSTKYTDKKFGWYTYSMFEMSNTINKEFLIYKYGNYFQYAIAFNYKLVKNLLLITNTKFEWRGKDTRESGLIVESSGSKVVILNPQLFYNIKKSWDIIIHTEIPIYKYVNGYQLTNKFAVQVIIRKNILFAGCH